MLHRVKNFLQHRLNPLHVFCRLCDMGVRPCAARRLCAAWEKLVYRPFGP